MSKESENTIKNSKLQDNQDSNGYTATEELQFDDLEAVARAVIRQRKISSAVSKHLTPQFEEYERAERTQNNQIPGTSLQSSENLPSTQQVNGQVTIDSDVFDSIIIGLAHLIDKQRRFADEFGIPQEHVFTNNAKEMYQRGSAEVIRDWLSGKYPEASSKIDALFEDLNQHQTCLLESLDTISRRTIKYLGPELSERNVHVLAKFGFMWAHYKKRNRKIAGDFQSRYKVIIAPGIADSYTKAKEKISNKSVKNNITRDH